MTTSGLVNSLPDAYGALTHRAEYEPDAIHGFAISGIDRLFFIFIFFVIDPGIVRRYGCWQTSGY
jgi:hypothetical protein